jgi:hypothetical protein
MPTTPNSPPSTDTADNKEAATNQELVQEDFYLEGPNLVFTAAYHLKRGYCCNSGCRHCPYGEPD